MNIEAQRPLVSVAILNWNGLSETKECLEHIRNSTYKNFEIIIVDNGSTDKSLAYLEKQKDILLIKSPVNTGFTGGHIAALRKASGEYILLLNNDAVTDKNYIKNAVEILQGDPLIGAVGGRAYLWDRQNPLLDEDNQFYSYQVINPVSAEGIFRQADSGSLEEVNVVSGSAVMIRKSVIDKIGYLHDRFFAYYEETDLFARMKRAGFKIMYSPRLKIWHKNGVSAQKKASGFSSYMMMRNRFIFATRNFERHYLLRFLLSYTKVNLRAFARAILYKKDRVANIAYSKAFLYNLAFGCISLIERHSLQSSLGANNYNKQITLEQTPLSIVVCCNTKTELTNLVNFSKSIPPLYEIVVVTSNAEFEKNLMLHPENSNIRVCLDNNLLDTAPLNIGAICAQHDHLLLAQDVNTLRSSQLYDIQSLLYQSLWNKRTSMVVMGETNGRPKNQDAVLSDRFTGLVMLRRSAFIDASGINKNLSNSDGLRVLLLYGFTANQLCVLGSEIKMSLAKYSKQNIVKLSRTLQAQFRAAVTAHKHKNFFSKLTDRYYRLYQITNVTRWIFSLNIPLRLKAGRIKNLLVATVTFERKTFAIELKHICNDVILRSGTSATMEAHRKLEKKKLATLLKDPTQLPVFIICRDRLSPLEILVPWLETQGLQRIIFVDNDSAFPPLVKYLSTTKYQVLRTKRNIGHTVPWTGGIIKVLLPEDFYIITDPDVIPSSSDPYFLKYLLELHKKYPYYMKVGPGLKIDDLPDYYTLKKDVVQWESQFWKNSLTENVFEAGIDTTFAIYKPFTYSYFIHPSIRTGEPFTARHLPWYTDTTKLTDEDIFYRLHADQAVSSWDKDILPERYKKELAKRR